MQTIQVELGDRSYPIVVTYQDAPGIIPFIRQRKTAFTGIVVIADSNTKSHAEKLSQELSRLDFRILSLQVPAGEASKSWDHVGTLLDQIAEWKADRQTLVLAIGGGVIGDLGGFVASIFNRGLPLMMAPTTLLAMVDSSVGGKVGINHAQGKNLIGSFHQPVGVWIDTATLDTLPDREFRSGLAEVVKYGVILDAEFFEWLEQHVQKILQREPQAIQYIIQRSCELKASIVEKDEREETGLRIVLNYGHTFAHAFETIAGYGTWLHGEAVSAGMICASRLAEKLQRIPPVLTNRQLALLERFGLPTKIPKDWNIDAMIDCMYRDKKAKAGKLRFVLPSKLGHVELVSDICIEMVQQVLIESC